MSKSTTLSAYRYAASGRDVLARSALLMLLSGVAVVASPADTPAPKLAATPPAPQVVEGSTVEIKVKLGNNAVDLDKFDIETLPVSPLPTGVNTPVTKSAAEGSLLFQAPIWIPPNVEYLAFKVTITNKTDSNENTTATVSVVHQLKTEWEARAIVGWHQAGASSADSSQHLFADFFVARPFGGGPVYEAPFNVWGQVRIASTPQQRTIPVSQFAVDFAAELGKVPVNELAQSGEFLTGFEFRPGCRDGIAGKPRSLGLCWSGPNRIRTVGFVVFFGAGGAFSDPTTIGRVFRAPASTSPQWSNFVGQFPAFQDAAFAARTPFIGLVPPDRERFFRQYGGGIRYTGYSRNEIGGAPSMYTATIGQDQAITRGRYVGPVLKFDAFYPLRLLKPGGPAFVYLFGTANLAVAKPKEQTPLALQLVSSPCAANAPAGDTGVRCGVQLSQENVAIFTVPSSRDTYRIGLGIDFLQLVKLWTSK